MDLLTTIDACQAFLDIVSKKTKKLDFAFGVYEYGWGRCHLALA